MPNIIIPEELEEMIKEIIAYEELDKQDEEVAEEYLYITPPPLYREEVQDTNKAWKIEIQL